MSCGLDQSCGMNQTCEMEQTCSAPMESCMVAPCETSCAPAPTPCAAPCQQSYTMPCNYNECGEEEGRTGFRQSVRNMFRRHSESSCSEQGYECDYNTCNPCEEQTCEPMHCMPEPVCQPCQPVCMPEPVCMPAPVCAPKPVMKKAYRTEQYTVQVPTEKKIKVAVCVPSFERKVICKQVTAYKTKWVAQKIPYCKEVKETIKVPTTKTVYKTQTIKGCKTETKCRKVPYWYCEEPKPVCVPEPVCSPCQPMQCEPMQCQPMSCEPCDYQPCGQEMRKRDRFMNAVERPFDAIEEKWDQKMDARKCREFEDSYDCRPCGSGDKKGFWRSFFGQN